MYYILDGKKIRELMEQQNMNVSKLSELSGVSQSCIRNILNEKAMSDANYFDYFLLFFLMLIK